MRGGESARVRGLVCAAWLCAAAGCGEEKASPPPRPANTADDMCVSEGRTENPDDEEPPEVECPSPRNQILCYGHWAAHCDGDEVLSVFNCRERDEQCYARACDDEDCDGCLPCRPGSVRCGEGGERERCDEDGSGYGPDEACDEPAGLFCNPESGGCDDLCAQAEESRSYIGCEYWAVPTLNSQLAFERIDEDGLCRPFSFAIVVANPQAVIAQISVETPDGERIERSVEPGETRVIELPCSLDLGGHILPPESEEEAEALLDAGIEQKSTPRLRAAHHVTSNVPVTVYQFNPLEYAGELADGEEIFSHTNDASLLLPVSSLRSEYRVIAAPTLLHVIESTRLDDELRLTGAGFIAIVGVEEDPVTVMVTSSAHTLESEDGALPALEPGQEHELTLARGEVAQLLSAPPEDCEATDEDDDNVFGGTRTYCNVSRDYDLTGTHIEASGRVLVLSGHDCVFLPYNRWACDHIEEAMPPLEAWGKQVYVSISETVACQDTVPNMIRVLASHDGTRVSFTPEVHDTITLDAGEHVSLELTEDVLVSASDAILVAQYLLGQNYHGRDRAGSFERGDPSLSIAIPLEQWRERYAILSPRTFPENYVNIIAQEGQLVLLDGQMVTGFTPIEGTEMTTARVPLSGGHHALESTHLFGISVYGYAPYTSYMVPGGLDLNLIDSPE